MRKAKSLRLTAVFKENGHFIDTECVSSSKGQFYFFSRNFGNTIFDKGTKELIYPNAPRNEKYINHLRSIMKIWETEYNHI